MSAADEHKTADAAAPSAPPNADEPLVVSIPSVGRDRDHVTFTVQVEKGDIVWSVTRRYRDFELLSKRLAQTFQKDRLPKLPPKRIKLGKAKYDEDFVEERRGLLLMYLVRVVLMADVQRVETLDDFLEFSENYIFGSLRAIEHIPEVQEAVDRLRRASAGTGSLTVSAPVRSHRPSFDDDGSSVRSRPPSEASSVTSEGESGRTMSHERSLSGTSGSGVGARTASSSAKPTLQAALEFMVATLRELIQRLRSEADDMTQKLNTQKTNLRFLTQRFRDRQEELHEQQRLWDEDRERMRRECEEAEKEKDTVNSHINLLRRELVSMSKRVAAFETQINVHNARYKALHRKLMARNNGQHPGPQPASPIPTDVRTHHHRRPQSVRTTPHTHGAQPPTPPRARTSMFLMPPSPRRGVGGGGGGGGGGGPGSVGGRSHPDFMSDDGDVSTVASSVTTGDVVPGAAAGIAAAMSRAGLRDAGGAGAGDMEPEEVSEEVLAHRVSAAEGARRLMEDLISQFERQPEALSVEQSNRANQVLLDVAASAGKIFQPGSTGVRAKLLKLIARVMQENIVLAQRLADARNAAHDASVIADVQSPAVPRRLSAAFSAVATSPTNRSDGSAGAGAGASASASASASVSVSGSVSGDSREPRRRRGSRGSRGSRSSARSRDDGSGRGSDLGGPAHEGRVPPSPVTVHM